MKGLIIGGVIFAIIAIIGVTQYIGYHNDWVDMEEMYNAQLENDKIIYDNTWKIIKQQAGVTEKYASDFKDVYAGIMESRNYGGEMMKWIQESNPAFDQSMYKQLMNTIDSKRTEFTANQKLLIGYHQQLNRMKKRFPSSVFLSGKVVPELVTITSGKTKQTFETGEENDVDVF